MEKMPQTYWDILIWKTSVAAYKKLGYKTKLYCKTEDIPFLKENKLFDEYDIIDTDFLDNFKVPENIDTMRFWAYRKLKVVEREYATNGNNISIYSDTDIVLYFPLIFDSEKLDGFIWCIESNDIAGSENVPQTVEEFENKFKELGSNPETIYSPYIKWSAFSKPEGYILPDYIEHDDQIAFNNGLFWMRDKEIFKEYLMEAEKFMTNNPCKILYEDGTVAERNSENGYLYDAGFICNAEQRMLFDIVKKHNNLFTFAYDGRVFKDMVSGENILGIHYNTVKKLVHVVIHRMACQFLNQLSYLMETSKAVMRKSLSDFIEIYTREDAKEIEHNYIKNLKEDFEYLDKLEEDMKNSNNIQLDLETLPTDTIVDDNGDDIIKIDISGALNLGKEFMDIDLSKLDKEEDNE